ncbi:class F sortase [Streptomyces sp. NPDC005017]|uniref:class F sortase n=1 Tax=Streptomyces sp. NPDC005017 TaxID=3364706 RepID=UPI0036B2DD63
MAARPPSRTDGDKDPQKPRSSRATALVMTAVACVIVTMTVFGGEDGPPADAAPPAPARATGPALPAPAATPATTAPATTRTGPAARPSAHGLARSKPLRLRIPKIAVNAPFTDLDIDASGQLEPPPADDINLVGWYADGPSPGEPGTSVIAGHVDTATSPAVFVRLGELEKGDRFQVDRADGRRATFVVDSAETFSKKDFPNERVYGDTAQPQVRLITCAGDYDRKVRDYTENLVVFAHLA